MADSFDAQAEEVASNGGWIVTDTNKARVAAALRAADAKARAEGEAAGEARGLERATAAGRDAFGKVTREQYVMHGPRAYMLAMIEAIRALAQPPPEGEGKR